MANYIPPLDVISKCLGCTQADLTGSGQIYIGADAFRLVVKVALAAMTIDVDLYLSQNPDLQGIEGINAEALRWHFINHGYFEGRPFPVGEFDEEYYLGRNIDVAKAYLSGAVRSPLDHYVDAGIREFRSPSANSESWVAEWAAVMSRRRPG